MDQEYNQPSENRELVKDIILVGQNVLEQEILTTYLGNLINDFPLLHSENEEIRASAYSCLFRVLVNYSDLLLRKDIDDKNSCLSIPALIKLINLNETTWRQRVLKVSEQLFRQNILLPQKNWETSGDYLSKLIPKETLYTKGKGFLVHKVRTAHRNLLFGIGDLILDQNPLVPLYVYYCKQEMGKTLTTNGVLRQTAFEAGSDKWQVKSFTTWSKQILEEAKDFPANGIMFGADNLGFATSFQSSGSVRDYFYQRGLIKNEE